MARIPDAELERLAEARGVKLKRVGKDLRGRCIFHGPDNDPSLSIDPQRNVFHCFGCGAKGGPVDWVMKADGVSFRHAVELLREAAVGAPASPRAGKGGRGRTAEVAASSPVKASTVRRLASPLTVDAAREQLLDETMTYYRATYLREPAPQEYTKGRGMGDVAFVSTFRPGYGNRTLGLRLPNKQRVAGAALRTRLEELGIFRPSGHEAFAGSLVLATEDEQGHVIGMYGRKITPGLKAGSEKHLYLKGPRRGVWNWQGLVDAGRRQARRRWRSHPGGVRFNDLFGAGLRSHWRRQATRRAAAERPQTPIEASGRAGGRVGSYRPGGWR